ncbi:polyhydroxyalkanoic acid system family protein [Sphingomonas prati]|uniref:Polyhydroxyalkanoic acid system protein n=1 Tax=Sphingomonas prati TaxID=1843237 RepID=A0A7W9BQC0_9SPHN|nr:polyhydroxyalkanoic acid system family protein [Sphingomonas prati]MBB5728157.1 hypothetical protein [Sphingomonas prati]GGE83696.1 hypothetical protein GCM10011404_15490 [Sphingomonas prati]
MANPTIIDLPHSLGRDEARRRIRSRIGELPGHIPGGVATVKSSWEGEDRMTMQVAAMGQEVTATLDVQDTLVRVSLILPGMLSFFTGAIAAGVKAKGSDLLLGDDSKTNRT